MLVGFARVRLKWLPRLDSDVQKLIATHERVRPSMQVVRTHLLVEGRVGSEAMISRNMNSLVLDVVDMDRIISGGMDPPVQETNVLNTSACGGVDRGQHEFTRQVPGGRPQTGNRG